MKIVRWLGNIKIGCFCWEIMKIAFDARTLCCWRILRSVHLTGIVKYYVVVILTESKNMVLGKIWSETIWGEYLNRNWSWGMLGLIGTFRWEMKAGKTVETNLVLFLTEFENKQVFPEKHWDVEFLMSCEVRSTRKVIGTTPCAPWILLSMPVSARLSFAPCMYTHDVSH